MEVALLTSYARWRQSSLGQLTERIEHDLVFELAGPLAGQRVLDAGCGDATYAIAAAERGANVSGVDSSPDVLAAARRKAKEHGTRVAFEAGDACALPFGDSAFDVVLAVTLLCLVEDGERAVWEMARVLKPGGRLVVGELGRFSSWAAVRRFRGWLGSKTWRHARFRSASELATLLASAGLVVERAEGAVYYPPLGLAARVLGQFDAWPRRLTTLGAAFIAVAGRKPETDDGRDVPDGSRGYGRPAHGRHDAGPRRKAGTAAPMLWIGPRV